MKNVTAEVGFNGLNPKSVIRGLFSASVNSTTNTVVGLHQNIASI